MTLYWSACQEYWETTLVLRERLSERLQFHTGLSGLHKARVPIAAPVHQATDHPQSPPSLRLHQFHSRKTTTHWGHILLSETIAWKKKQGLYFSLVGWQKITTTTRFRNTVQVVQRFLCPMQMPHFCSFWTSRKYPRTLEHFPSPYQTRNWETLPLLFSESNIFRLSVRTFLSRCHGESVLTITAGCFRKLDRSNQGKHEKKSDESKERKQQKKTPKVIEPKTEFIPSDQQTTKPRDWLSSPMLFQIDELATNSAI